MPALSLPYSGTLILRNSHTPELSYSHAPTPTLPTIHTFALYTSGTLILRNTHTPRPETRAGVSLGPFEVAPQMQYRASRGLLPPVQPTKYASGGGRICTAMPRRGMETSPRAKCVALYRLQPHAKRTNMTFNLSSAKVDAYDGIVCLREREMAWACHGTS